MKAWYLACTSVSCVNSKHNTHITNAASAVSDVTLIGATHDAVGGCGLSVLWASVPEHMHTLTPQA